MRTHVRPFAAAVIRAMPRRVVVALASMLGVSLTEGAGLLLLVPLLQVVGLDAREGDAGQVSQLVSSAFAALGLRPTLLSILTLYVVLVSLYAALSRWHASARATLEHEFISYLRRRLYRSIAQSNWLFLTRRRASDFEHALTGELDRVTGATYYLLTLAANSIVSTVYFVIAFQLSAPLTALVLVCGGVLFVLLRGPLRAARMSGVRHSAIASELYAATSEHLGSLKVTKSYGAEDRHARIFSDLAHRLARESVESARTYADARSWSEIGSVLILSGILYVSLEVLRIPVATVFVLLFLFLRIMPRLSGLQQSYQSLVNLLPSFERVERLRAECDAAGEMRSAGIEEVELRREVRLDQVSFAYADDAGQVIRGVDLAVRAGQTTAIVGPSGAGKSTIADLVIGLIVPDAGRVLVDGLPLGPERLRGWRARIGYVAQDTFLFHDTVRANLLWARPHASEPDIWNALESAAARELVAALPSGLDTVIGDRGVRLSGGERQRLALARALLREPSLLILDEATSSLDSENERRIQRAIDRLHGQMTILVITHRLSTIRRADLIYVIDRGQLVEAGGWAELLANRDGRFRALCNAQGIDVREADVGSDRPLLAAVALPEQE